MSSSSSAPNTTSNNKYVDLANKYMSLRLDGKNKDILNLCTDDVIVQSERDGTYTGKHEVEGYLNKVKPTGTWKTAKPLGKDQAFIPGIVNAFWIDWDAVGIFSFNQTDQIKKIELKRGKLD